MGTHDGFGRCSVSAGTLRCYLRSTVQQSVVYEHFSPCLAACVPCMLGNGHGTCLSCLWARVAGLLPADAQVLTTVHHRVCSADCALAYSGRRDSATDAAPLTGAPHDPI